MVGEMIDRLPDNLRSKISVNPSTGCWEWTGASAGNGYGHAWNGSRPERAHRVVYRLLVGSIKDGLQLDHLCRVRNCVNPAHLEQVTARVNTLRGQGNAAANAAKTHCSKGHEYSEDNLYYRGNRRVCKACHGAYQAQRYRDKAATDPAWHEREKARMRSHYQATKLNTQRNHK